MTTIKTIQDLRDKFNEIRLIRKGNTIFYIKEEKLHEEQIAIEEKQRKEESVKILWHKKIEIERELTKIGDGKGLKDTKFTCYDTN